MKANGAPKKLYLLPNGLISYCRNTDEDVEYICVDAFIEKAKKWFQDYTGWNDLEGNRHFDIEDFEDFRKAMQGE